MQISLRADSLSRIATAELQRQKEHKGVCEMNREMKQTLRNLITVGDRVALSHPSTEKKIRLIGKIADWSVKADTSDCMGEPWPALATGYYQAALEVTSALSGSLTPAVISAAAGNVLKGAKNFRPYGRGIYSSDNEKNDHLFLGGVKNLQILNQEVRDPEIARILEQKADPEEICRQIADLHREPAKTDPISLAQTALRQAEKHYVDRFAATKNLEQIVLAAKKEASLHPGRANLAGLIEQIAKNAQPPSWDLLNDGAYLASLEVITALQGRVTPQTFSAAARNLTRGQTMISARHDHLRDGYYRAGVESLKLLNLELQNPLVDEILKDRESRAAAFVTLGNLY